MLTTRNQGFILLPVVIAIALIAGVAFLMNRDGAGNVNRLAGEIATTQAAYVAKAGMNQMLWQVNNANCTGYANASNVSFGGNSYSGTISPTSNSPVSISVTASQAQGASYSIKRDRLKVYQPTVTKTLQLGTDAGKDAVIASVNPTANFGNTDGGVIKAWILIYLYRHQLIQFDLDKIPSNAHIVSAQLQLYRKSGSGKSKINAYRIKQDWLEGTQSGSGTADGATWKTRDGTNAWVSAGGDYAPTLMGTAQVDGSVSGIQSWEIGPLVQNWLTGKYPNYGLLLEASDMMSVAFAGKEDATAANRPKLVITYTCECGQTCTTVPTCSADYTPTIKIGQFSSLSYGSDNIKGLTYFPKGKAFNSVSAPSNGAWLSVNDNVDAIFMTDTSGTLLTSVTSPLGSATGIVYVSNGLHAGQLAMTDYATAGISWVNTLGTIVSTIAPSIVKAVGVTYLDTTASGTYNNALAVLTSATTGGRKVYLIDQSGNILKTLDVTAITASVEDITHIPNTDKLLMVDRSTKEVIGINFNGTELSRYSISPYGSLTANGLAINPLTCDHVIGDLGTDLVTTLNKQSGNITTIMLNAVADTDIYEGSTSSNYGGSATVWSGRATDPGKRYKGLIKFNVSSLPAGVTVTSAVLRLNETSFVGSGTFSLGIYKILASWNEGSATWANFGASANYNTTQLTFTPVTTASSGYFDWTLPVGLINEWKDGVPGPNYGLALVYESSSAGTVYKFASKEHASTTLRPQLIITYTTP